MRKGLMTHDRMHRCEISRLNTAPAAAPSAVMGHMERINEEGAEGAQENKKKKEEEEGRGRRRGRGGELWPHLHHTNSIYPIGIM